MFYKKFRAKFLLLIILLIGLTHAQNKYKLNDITFSGNDHFSNSILSSIILSQKSPPWYSIFLNSFTSFGRPVEYFDSANIQLDIQALKNFYNSNGYFNSKIICKIKKDDSEKTVDLEYNINEKTQFKIENIKLLGLSRLNTSTLLQIQNIFLLDSIRTFTQNVIDQKISNSVSYLTNNGYMFADYDSTLVEIDTGKASVNLKIYFTTGKSFRVNEVKVDKSGIGSESVNNDFLIELTDYPIGETYDREKILQRNYKLNRIDLFNSINLRPEINDTSGSNVPLVIDAKIGPLNALEPELITNDEQNYFNIGFRLTYSRKNFFGRARKFSIKSELVMLNFLHTDIGNLFKSGINDTTFQGYADIALTFSQPYMFNKPISGNLETYLKRLTLLGLKFNTIGGKLGFDFLLPEQNFINVFKPYYNLEFLQFLYRIDRANELKANSITSAIGAEIGSAKTDELLFPTSGSNISLLAEMDISNLNVYINGINLQDMQIPEAELPKETAVFSKLQILTTLYFPLSSSRKSLFALKLKAGLINMIKGSDQLVPPNRTFIAGGTNSIRGWRSRELVPLDSVEYFGLTTDESKRGGNYLIEGSFELRQLFSNNIGATLFADYGNVWNSISRIRFNQFAVAVGFGLRYYTPIAPIRIDFGFKFYDPFDQKFIFGKKIFNNFTLSFGIGEAF